VAGTIIGSGTALLVAMVVPGHGAETADGRAFMIAAAVLSSDHRR
jgi:hypothetical protein